MNDVFKALSVSFLSFLCFHMIQQVIQLILSVYTKV